jgi:hypothetical protein
MDVLLTLLSWVLGTVATIIITICIERLRSPSPRLSIEAPLNLAPRGPFKQSWRVLRVEFSNAPLPQWANSWLSRLAAQQCRAEISFLRADGTDYFGRPVAGRWASTPEPAVVHPVAPDGTTFPVAMNASQLKSTVDVYPGEAEHLDVAVRVDGEEVCYAWNDDHYYHEDWRDPNKKLDHRLWLVKVVVTSSGKKCTDHFRLINDGPFQSFRLDEPTQQERETIIRGGN